MVYLVDHMLPKEYFAHNLRALTVDMAVFRTYLAMKLPKLSAHLTKLQQESCDDCNGESRGSRKSATSCQHLFSLNFLLSVSLNIVFT